MAEKAVHFTSTASANPSVFEILAQNSLQNVLHPALQKIALFLATNKPKSFSWLNDYYEEVFLVFNAALQYHYLNNYNASFAENFYDLQRVTISNEKLSKQQKLLSLVFLAVSPYLRKKLDAKLAIYRLQHMENGLSRNSTGLLKKYLLISHSLFEAGWGSWLLFNYLRYMAGRTESQTPVLKLLGLKLVYHNEGNLFPNFWGALFRGNLSFTELGLGLFLKNVVSSSLELSAFFIQFLQTWNAEKSNYNVTALPVVPPPAYDNRANNYAGKCPICLQTWKIPTIVPVSGYVFCFQCILKHLRENSKCPITNLPANPLDIIRLYDD